LKLLTAVIVPLLEGRITKPTSLTTLILCGRSLIIGEAV